MDESVIFVGELRSGDSDILCVCDSDDNVKVEGKKSKKAIIGLGKESGTSSETIDKPQKELEENHKENQKICLECPICFESMQNVAEVKVTNCGHLFCGNCLKHITVGVPKPRCPKCRTLLIKKQVRTVFF